MKIKLNSLKIFFTLTLLFLLTAVVSACNFGGPVQIGGTDAVKIKSLDAVVEEAPEELQPVRKMSKLRKMSAVISFEDEEVLDDEEPILDENVNTENKNQYILIYRNETDIKFTINLDNPKGEAIDAIELTCDDENATILVDGEWEKIRYDNGKIILNWAQENAYKKTFYIKTTSEADINTIRVNDIKVNGAWQNNPLDNDELKIYRIDEADMSLNVLENTFDYAKFTFTHSKNVSNIKVKANGVELVPVSEDGEYEVTEDCKLEVSYDYTYAGVTVGWEYEIDFEMFKVVYDPRGDIGCVLCSDGILYLFIYGTGRIVENIEIYIEGELFANGILFGFDDYGKVYGYRDDLRITGYELSTVTNLDYFRYANIPMIIKINDTELKSEYKDVFPYVEFKENK